MRGLSPDMIWLTILQGLARHVANHSKTLRSRLVAHATKIELVFETWLDHLPRSNAEMLSVTRPFVELITKHVPPDKR